MTNEELWAIFVAKNPKMGGSDDSYITLTVRGLRRVFDQAYNHGHDQGFENGKAYRETREERKPSNSTKAFADLFGKDNPFA